MDEPAIKINRAFRRPPSLSESFAWTPENIERATTLSLTPKYERLLVVNDDIYKSIQPNTQKIIYYKYEKPLVVISIKFLLHITLISIFETLFYFLYVSSLENNGIENTINTFINTATEQCQATIQNQTSIQIINNFLGKYINVSAVIEGANQEEIIRANYNNTISIRAWIYTGALSGLFLILTGYVKYREINIKWKQVVYENVFMVLLLALYELVFFNTIIYSYEPISAQEIEKNAIIQFKSACGIF